MKSKIVATMINQFRKNLITQVLEEFNLQNGTGFRTTKDVDQAVDMWLHSISTNLEERLIRKLTEKLKNEKENSPDGQKNNPA